MADAIAQQQSVKRARFFYAVECPYENEMIGSVGHTLRGSDAADCGWFLLPAYWGKGHAVQAVRELLMLAFGAGGITRMTAWCSVENQASVRVAEKCGFRLTSQIQSRACFEIRTEEFHCLEKYD
ncbi:GNAT family N-acetyltransferase [Burkholderia paludis]|uniref:GNAT family N-acetyltransferase n=1 Tax=Burkholderia paludis TaxID=1506587 RepID=UPI0009DE8FC8